MDDLTTWLRAQLDDDEQTARKAGASSWSVGVEETSDGENAYYSIGAHGEEPFVDTDVTEHAKFDHIVRWDPARVLREVEAKRTVIREWEMNPGGGYPNFEGGYATALEAVIAMIAAAYSDRPGYQESWRP